VSYTRLMRYQVLAAAVLAVVSSSLAGAQERDVPKDSERLSLRGCARGRTFIVAPRSEHEPVRSDVEPGRRFRLSGPKKILDDIKAREVSMLEVTGLVRKSQVSGPGGVAIAGGRIRIGGGVPRDPIYSDPRRDPMYNEVVMDVESFTPLTEECPSR
jgi:hypothetical protein